MNKREKEESEKGRETVGEEQEKRLQYKMEGVTKERRRRARGGERLLEKSKKRDYAI